MSSIRFILGFTVGILAILLLLVILAIRIPILKDEASITPDLLPSATISLS